MYQVGNLGSLGLALTILKCMSFVFTICTSSRTASTISHVFKIMPAEMTLPFQSYAVKHAGLKLNN